MAAHRASWRDGKRCTVPELGALSPAISRSAVDFPQPDGPSSETNSPLRDVEIERPERATPLS